MENNYEILFRNGLNASRPVVENAIDIAKKVCAAFAMRLYSGDKLNQFLSAMDNVICRRIDFRRTLQEDPLDMTDNENVTNAVIKCYFEVFADMLWDEPCSDEIGDIDYEADGNNSWFSGHIEGEYTEEAVCSYLYSQIQDAIENKEDADNTAVIGAQEVPISLIELLLNSEYDQDGSEMIRRKIATIATTIRKNIRSDLDNYKKMIDINMLENDEGRDMALAFIICYQEMLSDPFGKDTVIKYCNLVENNKTVGDMQIHGTLLYAYMNQKSDEPYYYYIDWVSMLEVVTRSHGKINIRFDVDRSKIKVTTSKVEDHYVKPNPDGSIPEYLEKVEYLGNAPDFVMTLHCYNENRKPGTDDPYWLEDKLYQMKMTMDVDLEVAVRAILYIKHLYVLIRHGEDSAWNEIEKCSKFDNKQWEEFLKDKTVLVDEIAD